MNYEQKIKILGKRLVHCQRCCDGIANDRAKGILPRGLYFEKGDSRKGGCIVVGINPGIASTKEMEAMKLLSNAKLYEKLYQWWSDNIKTKHLYHIKLKNFVNALFGSKCPIVWTELAKCQNKKKKKLPPLQTFRRCTDQYLSRELEILPSSWLLIAAGEEAYKALAYRYSHRTLIGIPHPMAWGAYAKVMNGKRLTAKSEKIIRKILGRPGQCVWLGEK